MASEYYGVNRGSDLQPNKVTFGTSTGGTDIELRVDLTKGFNRKEVLNAIKALENFILHGLTTGGQSAIQP